MKQLLLCVAFALLAGLQDAKPFDIQADTEPPGLAQTKVRKILHDGKIAFELPCVSEDGIKSRRLFLIPDEKWKSLKTTDLLHEPNAFRGDQALRMCQDYLKRQGGYDASFVVQMKILCLTLDETHNAYLGKLAYFVSIQTEKEGQVDLLLLFDGTVIPVTEQKA